MNTKRTDQFLSDEDLAIRDMKWEELIAWWNLWLEQAQITNDIDQDEYSHGVFRHVRLDHAKMGQDRKPE